jgi:hypothetical protein
MTETASDTALFKEFVGRLKALVVASGLEVDVLSLLDAIGKEMGIQVTINARVVARVIVREQLGVEVHVGTIDGVLYASTAPIWSAEEALAELVALKRIDDTEGKTEDYRLRKPLAWRAAFNAHDRRNRPRA